MYISLRQEILIYILCCKIFTKVGSDLIKRSPLELGFVTFPEIEKPKRLIIVNKPIVETNTNESRIHLPVPAIARISHSHEWIPGQIKHHSYLPAHLHHIFIPVLIPVSPLAPLQYEYYPKHFGGFGIGSHSGGQGAGHGFQIFFNN